MEIFTSTALYNFLKFYFVWIAFVIFIGGSIYRVYTLIDLAKKEKVVLPFISLKATLRSLLHWLIPFGSRRWRLKPVFTIAIPPPTLFLFFTPPQIISFYILLYEF